MVTSSRVTLAASSGAVSMMTTSARLRASSSSRSSASSWAPGWWPSLPAGTRWRPGTDVDCTKRTSEALPASRNSLTPGASSASNTRAGMGRHRSQLTSSTDWPASA